MINARQVLADSMQRMLTVGAPDRALFQLLRQRLQLDGRGLSSNGVRYYPTHEAPTAQRILDIAQTLKKMGWTVDSDIKFNSTEGMGRTMVLRHSDVHRAFNVVTLTTELSCITLSSSIPSVFDL